MELPVELVWCHHDDRGVVFEPLASELFAKQRNAHVVVSRPGVVRGNHMHRTGTETVVMQGPGRARFMQGEQVRDVRLGEGEVVRFVIPPGIAHAFVHTGEHDGLLVAFNTCRHDPDAPDVVRVSVL